MSNEMVDNSIPCMDMKTPRNVYLCAIYKRSFAYHTVKNRMPVLLTQVIDTLARNKDKILQKYGEMGQNDLKIAIGKLSKLKYEIQTNKGLRKLESSFPDAVTYNNYLDNQGDVTFFTAIWLLSECYMYRRVAEAFEQTIKLQDFDPFRTHKQDAYVQAVDLMTKFAGHLLEKFNNVNSSDAQSDFIKLIKLNLWGNRCDLSLTDGKQVSNIDHLFNLENLEKYILCDHSERIWSVVSKGNCRIDIVLDNSGYELFTDLCLADFLIRRKLASSVRFYVKTIPWFISDVMMFDFTWFINQFKNHENDYLKALGTQWSEYLTNKIWMVLEEDFWTLPFEFSHMPNVNPSLYKKLAEADLIIFKGDLNYRKLFGEKNWDPTVSLDEGLNDFNPAKLCTLRTIKSDIVCGLETEVAERTLGFDEDWMCNGDYGLIQLSDKIVLL